MDTKNPTIGSLVWHLSIRWRTEVERIVAPFDLTHAQYSALASLHEMTGIGGPPTQRELAGFMGLTPIYVSKLIRALETGGNLRRDADPHDSRAYRLILTEAGNLRVAKARQAVAQLDRRLTQPLGDPNGPIAREFMDTLKTLIRFHQQNGDT